MKKRKSEIREVEEEVYLLDDMWTALVELLEEKEALYLEKKGEENGTEG